MFGYIKSLAERQGGTVKAGKNSYGGKEEFWSDYRGVGQSEA